MGLGESLRRGPALRSLELLPREAGSRHANVCHTPGSSGLRCWLRPLSGPFSVSSLAQSGLLKAWRMLNPGLWYARGFVGTQQQPVIRAFLAGISGHPNAGVHSTV